MTLSALMLALGCVEPAALGPGPDEVPEDSRLDSRAEPDDSAVDSPTEPAPVYLVVSTPSLAEGARAWADWRAEQGFQTRVMLTTELVADPLDTGALVLAVQDQLRALSGEGVKQYLLLVGDAVRGAGGSDRIGVVTCENDLDGCYTDSRYGDLDGDGVPEAAVGRIPAQTEAQLREVLAHTRAQEEEISVGAYNRRLVFWAGETGFDAQLTLIAESLVMEGLAQVDPAWEIMGVYADRSSFYYDSPFEARALSLLNDGGSLAIYMGHGSSRENEGLSAAALADLDQGTRAPFMALFACYNGRFAEDATSMSESLLLLGRGPSAVLASAGESHPYANGLLPYELQKVALGGEVERVGDAVLAAKRNALLPAGDDGVRSALDLYARLDYGYSDEDLVRILHQNFDLYNLLGDPALRLQRPTVRLELEAEGRWRGGSVSVHGLVPGMDEGQALVSFDVPRDMRLGEGSWEAAINTAVTSVEVPVVDGGFDATLDFDIADLPGGTFFIKAYAQNAEMDAFGVVDAP